MGDKTYLSVYLQCNVNRTYPDGENAAYSGACNINVDGDDPPVEGKTNTRYNVAEIEQRDASGDGPVVEDSNFTYLGSYKNENGNLLLKGSTVTQFYPPPGQERPLQAGLTNNNERPSGCYVNLTEITPFTDDPTQTLKTGSLSWNRNMDYTRPTSRATKLTPKICQATEIMVAQEEVDPEFSLLFIQ